MLHGRIIKWVILGVIISITFIGALFLVYFFNEVSHYYCLKNDLALNAEDALLEFLQGFGESLQSRQLHNLAECINPTVMGQFSNSKSDFVLINFHILDLVKLSPEIYEGRLLELRQYHRPGINGGSFYLEQVETNVQIRLLNERWIINGYSG